MMKELKIRCPRCRALINIINDYKYEIEKEEMIE